jgi:hypothetical protein
MVTILAQPRGGALTPFGTAAICALCQTQTAAQAIFSYLANMA